jgi:hypothetical protein
VLKYADHLPLYRQAQIYARQGIGLDRSTLADWVGHAAWHLRPLQERLLLRLKERPRLFADETGQLWAYASSDWLGRETPARRRALDRDPQSDQRLSAGGPGPHDPLAERRTQDAGFSGPQILVRGFFVTTVGRTKK